CIASFKEVPLALEIAAIFAFAICLVIGCCYEFTGIAGNILNHSKLHYLGKISYGLYLYHKPIPYFIQLVLSKTNLHIHNLILLLISIALTIAVAHLSFRFLEMPFLKFKERFDL
ncbi:MAG: hypothetical protein ACKOSR_14680, partial [Flavobacteriales bacterium]